MDVKLDSYVVDFEYKVLAGTQEYLGKSRAAFPAAVVPVSLSDEGARKRIAEIINGKMIEILPQVIADNRAVVLRIEPPAASRPFGLPSFPPCGRLSLPLPPGSAWQ
ncbi:hypothetical protein [Pseudomonas aeruginosa]|uniref:hypothetical protein n=1 Tax=Pseudomonas aeruginosa TaxID=287 RepID=UPI00128EBE06|nr:hypothetical protein [Pseudomonas aeruginosa]